MESFAWFLASNLCLASVLIQFRTLYLRNSIAYIGLGPTRSINKQENTPKDISIGQYELRFSSIEIFFLYNSRWCQIDN